ncbi:ATP-dependent DNA helicase MER3, partial [Paramarasmius palmivorus]
GEKWDSLTRNWSDHTQILSLIQLFLVDEVHILNEPRGSTLEVVVSRMKLRGSSVRFVVVSATVPNIEDIAAWIGSNTRLESSARVYQFGEEFRPCKLTRHVISVNRPKGQNDFAFARTLDNHLFGALQKHAAGKPILVFVSTRKGVFTTAEQLVKDYNDAQQKKKPLPWNRPGSAIDRVFNDKRLADLAAYGIGVHHAGMTVEDRRAVEELLHEQSSTHYTRSGREPTSVSLKDSQSTMLTTSAAAHTVVIRGVHTFQNNAVVEYSDLDVMQMLGRAGRPQFDKEGVAVIICESELEHKYRTLAQGKTIVESSLHNNLPEHLNSEIGLGTINDISSAKGWLKSSFLYQRLQKNPRHYSLNKEEDQSWEERIDDIVTQSVDSLRESELIAAQSTKLAQTCYIFYIRQATMRSILAIPEHVSMRTMLETISAAEEYYQTPRDEPLNSLYCSRLTESKLRSSERSAYNNLRRHNDIRFEVKKLEHTRDKVFILIQAILGGISLSNPEYKSGDSQVHLEAFSVFRHLPRIARAVVEVAITRKRGAQLKHGLELLRCFAAKAWEDRPVVLRQLDSIGEKSIKILAEHGIVSIETLRKQDALRLEMLLNRKPPYGHTLLAAARELPSYSLKIVENDVTSYGGRAAVDVSLKISCGLLEETSGSSKVKKQKTSWLSKMTAVVTLTSDLEYIDFRRIPTKALKEQKTFDLDVILEKPSQSVIVYITSEAYAGVTVSNSYKPNIPASEYPTRVTKPPSLMDIELEGLEDCPELFNMDDIDANGDPIELPPKPVAVKDLTKKNTSSKEKETNPISPEPEKLPNGNYRFVFATATTLARTRQPVVICVAEMVYQNHLPNLSKSHASSSKPNPPGSSSATVTSNASRPRPVPVKPNKKPIVKTDRTLQDLEDWHKNTNVETNLKLPEGHRLKLESLPRTHATPLTRKKLPTPDFNIQFSQIKEDFEDSYMTRELAELSDEELPEAADILAPTAGRAHKRKRSSDYDDEEMDSLIRTLPDEDAWGITSPVKENRGMKRPKKTPEQKMDRSKTPLFLPSPTSVTRANTWKEQDDDDEVEIPPTSTADDFDDYTLDPQFFDITPPTPDLEMSTHSSEDEPSLEFEAQPTTGTTTKVDDAYGTSEQPMQNEEMDEPMKDYMEEEFAMLEAWLNSSAVEIVPN